MVTLTITGETSRGKPIGWARVWPAAKPGVTRMLRRGAWYPVVDDSDPQSVTVIVARQSRRIPRRILEIRDNRPPPARFTVVYRTTRDPNPVRGTKQDLGMQYAVCPECGARARLYARPERLTCQDCGYRAEIAWWETG